MTADKPKRVQRKRRRGWKNPPNTIYVGRPSEVGNPYIITKFKNESGNVRYAAHHELLEAGKTGGFSTKRDAAAFAVKQYKAHIWQEITTGRISLDELDDWLGQHHLACWCALCPKHAHGRAYDEECPDCHPCHVDELLKIVYRKELKEVIQ